MLVRSTNFLKKFSRIEIKFQFQGEEIFKELMAAGTTRNISIRIVENKPSHYVADLDTKELAAKGAAQVQSLDFNELMGGGILHTKFWVVDKKHLYLGSANMDYRALTQVMRPKVFMG